MNKLQNLYDKFISQAEYYENHPMFPSYCMNAIANTYRQAVEFVKMEQRTKKISDGDNFPHTTII
jgi:hypothetical protein